MTTRQSEFLDFSLVVFFRGLDDAVRYDVSEEEFARAKAVVYNDGIEEKTLKRFFCFDTLDGRSVAISLRDVDIIHYLQDPVKHRLFAESMGLEPEPVEPTEIPALTVRFVHRTEPMTLSVDLPEDLFNFMIELDGDAFGTDIYRMIADSSAEDMAINTRHLLWVEASTHLLEEGRRELEI